MNIPKFTAETSLYKVSDSYHVSVNFAQNRGGIIPAQLGDTLNSTSINFPPGPFPPWNCFYPCEQICINFPPGPFPPNPGSLSPICFYPCKPICLPW